jgi:esterase/lipase superfamily enzyme
MGISGPPPGDRFDHKPPAYPSSHLRVLAQLLGVNSAVFGAGVFFYIAHWDRWFQIASHGLAFLSISYFGYILWSYYQSEAIERHDREQQDLRKLQRRVAELPFDLRDEIRRRDGEVVEQLEKNAELTERLVNEMHQLSDLLNSGIPPRIAKYASGIRTVDEAPPSTTVTAEALARELADRDLLALNGALEHSQGLIRGQPPNPCEYRVWFGTDRRLVVDGDFSVGFSDEFSDTLRCGSCVVYVPQSHAFGSIGSAFFTRIVKKIRGKPADEKLKLLAIEAGTPESLVNELRVGLSELPDDQRDLVLFVHGYNVDFAGAAVRAAQMGRDLELPGPMVFYSWPSKATLQGYHPDEATIDRTIPKFKKFLELLLTIPEANGLNIIAHSVGNRLLQRSIALFAAESDSRYRRFGHIVMAAPDIDRETFRQAAEQYAQLKSSPGRRTTLYFNYKDLAVGASAHGEPPFSVSIRSCGSTPGSESTGWDTAISQLPPRSYETSKRCW